jgi:hypothetical protein
MNTIRFLSFLVLLWHMQMPLLGQQTTLYDPVASDTTGGKYRMVLFGSDIGYEESATSSTGRYLIRSAIGTASFTDGGLLTNRDSSIRMEIGMLQARMIPTLDVTAIALPASTIRDSAGGLDVISGICLGDTMRLAVRGIDNSIRSASEAGFNEGGIILLHGDDTVHYTSASEYWTLDQKGVLPVSARSLPQEYRRRVFRDDTIRIAAVHGNYQSKIDTIVLHGRRLWAALDFGDINLNPKDLVAAANVRLPIRLTVDSSFQICAPDTMVVRFRNNRTLFRPRAIITEQGDTIGTVAVAEPGDGRMQVVEARIRVDTAHFLMPGNQNVIGFIVGHLLLGDDSVGVISIQANTWFPTVESAALPAKPADSMWMANWYRGTAPYYYAGAEVDTGTVRLSELCGTRLLTYPSGFFARIVSVSPLPASTTVIIAVEVEGDMIPTVSMYSQFGSHLVSVRGGEASPVSGGWVQYRMILPVADIASGTYHLSIDGMGGQGNLIVITH